MTNQNDAPTLVYPRSLADTLDAVNAALFFQAPLSAASRAEAADWIADRQGLPGSYAGMFAPTEHDYSFGAFTFTGERVTSAAGTAHLLSEEACRALLLLGEEHPGVSEALRRARRALFHRLEQSEVDGANSGVYCCGTCSVALWRHMAASREGADARRLENGLKVLRHSRDGKGRWKRFPFYYTLLALSEIALPGRGGSPNQPGSAGETAAAREELLYAADVMERALRRLLRGDPDSWSEHDRRRKTVMDRALELC